MLYFLRYAHTIPLWVWIAFVYILTGKLENPVYNIFFHHSDPRITPNGNKPNDNAYINRGTGESIEVSCEKEEMLLHIQR